MVASNPFNDGGFSTGYGDLSVGQTTSKKEKRSTSNAGPWDTTEEIALGDTNGLGSEPVPVALDTGVALTEKEIKKRDKELTKREKELAKREEQLRQREAALAAAGGAIAAEVKNWPKCYPIIHHDIDADIVGDFNRAVKAAWMCYWSFAVVSTYNWIASIVALVTITGPNKPGGLLPGMFLALIYLVAGVPLLFVTWYRPLYRGAMNDKAFGLAWFFLATLGFLVFLIWSTVGPDILVSQFSHAGVMSTITCFDHNNAAGVVYLIGAVLWGLQTLFTLVVLKMVYSRFRGRGGSGGTLKEEIVMTAISRKYQSQNGSTTATATAV